MPPGACDDGLIDFVGGVEDGLADDECQDWQQECLFHRANAFLVYAQLYCRFRFVIVRVKLGLL